MTITTNLWPIMSPNLAKVMAVALATTSTIAAACDTESQRIVPVSVEPPSLPAHPDGGEEKIGSPSPSVGRSPWGSDDQIGRLNLMTDASRAAILSRVTGGEVYDLSVEYFIGMPSWQAAGDPHYRIWMTHTPHGTVVDDPLGLGDAMNDHVSYTGAAVSMYTHMGTHIDALSHFGLNGRIYNGFRARDHLGDRGWTVAGAEMLPPIIARGVLVDVARARGVEMLPDGYRITRDDLVEALEHQRVAIRKGDVVLIRTGRMRVYEDAAAYMDNPPGMGMAAARYLVEERGAMVVGADNLSFEAFPSEVEGNYVPLHTYLLAQQGAPILELVHLEELAEQRVYEFAFVGGSLKLRGADAAPLRPVALPVRSSATEEG
jgi:kynurenine formamidase